MRGWASYLVFFSFPSAVNTSNVQEESDLLSDADRGVSMYRGPGQTSSSGRSSPCRSQPGVQTAKVPEAWPVPPDDSGGSGRGGGWELKLHFRVPS